VRADLAAKLEVMAGEIRKLEGVLVAYSGGVDSSLVLEVSSRALGDGCLGVIAQLTQTARCRARAGS